MTADATQRIGSYFEAGLSWVFGRKNMPTMSAEDRHALKALEVRLKTILPPQYQECYEDVQPVSMGSAGLKYGSDGQVAWNEMWGSFCDLAMAGGPPHKGTLLEPGSPAEIDADPERYAEVVEEICRGIRITAGLPAQRSEVPGWISVDCGNPTMAEWLVRAIAMENVSVRSESMLLKLPAGPGYRIAKEIKNVITAVAKTSHYWVEHMSMEQNWAIGNLFSMMATALPLVQPALPGYGFKPESHDALCREITDTVGQATGLRPSAHRYAGWLGLECPSVQAAIWMMRALVASNILSRREESTLFVPVNPVSDPEGVYVGQLLTQIHGFAVTQQILSEDRAEPARTE
jgi:hypothetical protein